MGCSQCYARLFPGMAFCPCCGTRRTELTTEATIRGCPSCATRGMTSALHTIRLGELSMHECRACAGVWVDRGVMHELEADRTARATLGSEPGRRTLFCADIATAAPVRYRRCPECATVMTRTNIARISGVVVDRCAVHGDFFDADELPRLVRFWDEGGLDRLRRYEREVIAGERRRIALLQTIDAKRDAWAGHRPQDPPQTIAEWLQRMIDV
jgi:Zn-finger nucleic acid-binding protein